MDQPVRNNTVFDSICSGARPLASRVHVGQPRRFDPHSGSACGSRHGCARHGQARLEEDGDGRKAPKTSPPSRMPDGAGLRLHDDAHLPRPDPTGAERIAVVAQGGYGRGLLAPGSDIDLLFCSPTSRPPGARRRRIHALSTVGPGLQGRPRHPQYRPMHPPQPLRHDNPHRPARRAADPRRPDFFDDFRRRFREEVLQGNPRPFIEAKLAEQNTRHARSGASRYLVEPNVKDGKGGLRDLHTLHWLAKHLYPDKAEAEFVEAGVFTAHEYRSFRRCESFLWTVRCELHFSHRASRGASLLRAAAGHGGTARLSRSCGSERGRALHAPLFPGGEGGRPADRHRLLGARAEAAEIAAHARHAACPLQLAPPRQAQAHVGFPHRERPHFHRRQGCLRQGPGEFHPPLLLCRRASGVVLAGSVAADSLERPPDRRQAPRQPDGQSPLPATS